MNVGRCVCVTYCNHEQKKWKAEIKTIPGICHQIQWSSLFAPYLCAPCHLSVVFFVTCHDRCVLLLQRQLLEKKKTAGRGLGEFFMSEKFRLDTEYVCAKNTGENVHTVNLQAHRTIVDLLIFWLGASILVMP